MTTSTTNDVHLSLYQRDARFYLERTRRPAVQQVKSIISDALDAADGFTGSVEFDVPRDLAERCVRLTQRPIRLPVSNDSLSIMLKRALSQQPREGTVFDEEEDEPASDGGRISIDGSTNYMVGDQEYDGTTDRPLSMNADAVRARRRRERQSQTPLSDAAVGAGLPTSQDHDEDEIDTRDADSPVTTINGPVADEDLTMEDVVGPDELNEQDDAVTTAEHETADAENLPTTDENPNWVGSEDGPVESNDTTIEHVADAPSDNIVVLDEPVADPAVRPDVSQEANEPGYDANYAAELNRQDDGAGAPSEGVERHTTVETGNVPSGEEFGA